MQKRFLEIWHTHIHREGSEALLDWLCKTDFFSAPASTKFHCAYEGGLCEHSVNVYERLVQLVATLPEKKRPSDETVAIVALCHDLCKVDTYRLDPYTHTPKWIRDERIFYGHGEKSAMLVTQHMKLNLAEALAIRFHMGACTPEAKGGDDTYAKAFERYPLAVLLHEADMLATYIDEPRG